MPIKSVEGLQPQGFTTNGISGTGGETSHLLVSRGNDNSEEVSGELSSSQGSFGNRSRASNVGEPQEKSTSVKEYQSHLEKNFRNKIEIKEHPLSSASVVETSESSYLCQEAEESKDIESLTTGSENFSGASCPSTPTIKSESKLITKSTESENYTNYCRNIRRNSISAVQNEANSEGRANITSPHRGVKESDLNQASGLKSHYSENDGQILSSSKLVGLR